MAEELYFADYGQRDPLVESARNLTRATGKLHLPSFDGTAVVAIDSKVPTFLPSILATRSRNIPRVTFLHRDNITFGAYDVSVDREVIGGVLLGDSNMAAYTSWPSKSSIAILHDEGFEWPYIRDFVGVTMADNHHIQLQQIEFIHELTRSTEAAKMFYQAVHTAAGELAQALLAKGENISSIFLGGGAALLLDPNNMPNQVFSRERMVKFTRKPISAIAPEDLASTLFDVDIQIFGLNEPEHIDWEHILSHNFGTIFSPLGLEPDRIIANFPDTIGMDIAAYPDIDLPQLLRGTKADHPEEVRVSLVRWSHMIKQSTIHLGLELINRMIPIWWSPDRMKEKAQFHEALSTASAATTGFSEKFLEDYAHNPMYGEPTIRSAIQKRLRLQAEGLYMDDALAETIAG